METMNEQLIQKGNQQYIYLPAQGDSIQAEQDALDIISLCGGYHARLVLIDGQRISDDFLRLRTGVAGAVLQKWIQYEVKVAVVLDMARVRGKFEDFLLETNRGKDFRAYETYEEAEAWLLQ